jgi:putative SOS response-associated peptidase YedK
LIPADGFYEWKKTETGKIPIRFTLLDGSLFAFAGIYFEEENGIKSFAILTTIPNSLVSDVHDRMPVILAPGREKEWLCADSDPEVCLEFCQPYPAEKMKSYSVSRRINSTSQDDASLIQPIEYPENPSQKELF